MKTIELTDEQHDVLMRLAYEGTMHPPSPSSSNSSVIAANTLCLHLRPHLEDAEETPDTSLVHKLYELFDDLKEFDVKTGERAFFKESLEALLRVLPKHLKREPLVVGSYLMKIMANPAAAGFIIVQAWELGDGMTKR
jgi:hypothetical protein